MAVRQFDGSNDELTCANGSFPTSMTSFSWAAIIERNANSAWHHILGINGLDGATPRSFTWIEITNGNVLQVGAYTNSGYQVAVSTFTVQTTDGWVIIAGTKAAGASTPRLHKYVFSTDTWTHEAGGTTVGDVATGVTGHAVKFSSWENSDRFSGKYALAAGWSSALSDAEVEDLSTNLNVSDWTGHAVAPVSVWPLNQANVTDGVEDLVGTSDETGRVDTTVIIGDDPPGFSFSSGNTFTKAGLAIIGP
jgi:hypothetical protein